MHSKTTLRGVNAFLSVLLFVLGCSFAVNASAQHVYYRYVNKDGVKVLEHSIPPEYAQLGYEVLNASGQVVKVVPPAPTDEEVAKNAQEREAREIYARLKRRYSSAAEIESAKRRRLANIDTNIAILKGNISTVTNEIQKIMGKAADYERRNQKVPAPILQSLNDAKAELEIAQELLKSRQEEYQEVIEKYDSDKDAFVRGETLEAKEDARIQ
ncbi:hypothetical protein WKI13_20185 [Teredinibacter turnerae]|uniref:hypothetical protein n=1 Tax=Teredinibacter turnerae TaxID=2426 RepID=UPI00035C957E|nr:hypothetical protein [Teredinibacter turnerae]